MEQPKTFGFCMSPSGTDERLSIFLTILTIIPFLRIPRHCPGGGIPFNYPVGRRVCRDFDALVTSFERLFDETI